MIDVHNALKQLDLQSASPDMLESNFIKGATAFLAECLMSIFNLTLSHNVIAAEPLIAPNE